MTYEEIISGRLEGQTVVEVAEAKGGGLAILFDDGPTILIVGGNNDTMCVQGGDWQSLWDSVIAGGPVYFTVGVSSIGDGSVIKS